MTKKLESKTAVITGGTEGIGLATAKLFVQEGAHVFITGRRQKELDEAVKAIGPNAVGVRGDVAKMTDLDLLYETVGKVKGRLHRYWCVAGVAASREAAAEGHSRLYGRQRAAGTDRGSRTSIIEQVKIAYIRLAYLQQTVALLESTWATLSQVIDSQLTRYSAGQRSEMEVLKAQIDRTRLAREITMHHERCRN